MNIYNSKPKLGNRNIPTFKKQSESQSQALLSKIEENKSTKSKKPQKGGRKSSKVDSKTKAQSKGPVKSHRKHTDPASKDTSKKVRLVPIGSMGVEKGVYYEDKDQ